MPPNAWHNLASKLLDLNKQDYIFIVDYFSKYPVLRKMPNIVKHVKNFITKALEVGKPWFYELQKYTNSPQISFTSSSNGMLEVPYQPSSIASSQ